MYLVNLNINTKWGQKKRDSNMETVILMPQHNLAIPVLPDLDNDDQRHYYGYDGVL